MYVFVGFWGYFQRYIDCQLFLYLIKHFGSYLLFHIQRHRISFNKRPFNKPSHPSRKKLFLSFYLFPFFLRFSSLFLFARFCYSCSSFPSFFFYFGISTFFYLSSLVSAFLGSRHPHFLPVFSVSLALFPQSLFSSFVSVEK